MEIFIGNLPGDINALDLKVLLNNTLRNNVFNKVYDKLISKGLLDKANSSFRICEKESQGHVSHYGYIDIRSKKIAHVAIEMLDQVNFNGCDIVVREYRHRTYINERRNMKWRENPWCSEERRLIERRDADEFYLG